MLGRPSVCEIVRFAPQLTRISLDSAPMVLKAYLDSSVLNGAVDSNLSALSIREGLARLSLEPATGLHTIFELARTFLDADAEGHSRARKLFSVLQDLEPAYQPEVPALITAEIEKLRVGTAVLPFLSGVNLASTRMEVARLAQGFFDSRARRFIEDKELERAKNHEVFGRQVAKVQAARTTGGLTARLRTFDDVWKYFEGRGDIPRLIADVVHHRVTSPEAAELAARLSSFPAISAATRANVYLNFIMLANAASPGKDKLDDFTHCIEASYTGALMSADPQQLTALAYICPHVRGVSWADVFAATGGAV